MTQQEKIDDLRARHLDMLMEAIPGTQEYNDRLNDYEQFTEIDVKLRKQELEERRHDAETSLEVKKVDVAHEEFQAKIVHTEKESWKDILKNLGVQALKGGVAVFGLLGVAKLEESTVLSGTVGRILGGIIDSK